jgi:hypothetical protein
MACKCGARTYTGHLRKWKEQRTSAHVYRGYVGLTEPAADVRNVPRETSTPSKGQRSDQ